MVALTAFFLVLSLFLGYLFYTSNTAKYRKDLQVRIDQYKSLLSRDIRQATAQVEQYFSESAYYKKIVSGKIPDYEWAKSVYHIKNDLTTQAASLPFSGGIFFYDRYRDRFFSSYKDYKQSTLALNEFMKSTARSAYTNRLYYGHEQFRGDTFLVYYLSVNNNPIGFILNLTDYYQTEDGVQVALTLGSEGSQTSAMLASFGQALLSEAEIRQCAAKNGHDMMIRSSLVMAADIPVFPGLRILTVGDTNKYSLLHQREFWFLIAFLLVAFLYVNVFFTGMIKRTLLSPVTHLHEKLTQIKQQGSTAQAIVPEEIEEYRDINNQIDTMIQQINDYKEKQLKEQLRTNEALLQYYQLQTNPHFFLSCLNTVSSLLENGKKDVANKLIRALSAQFRYFFRASLTFVPLREELVAAQDYCDISSIRSGSPILLSKEITDEVTEASIPLLSVMTFVENAIKHFNHPNRILTIRIQASIQTQNDTRSICLRIMDNGKGYPQDTLNELNAPIDSYTFVPDRVGITNLKYRMKLLYGDHASWYFYNSPLGSAVAELKIEEGAYDCINH